MRADIDYALDAAAAGPCLSKDFEGAKSSLRRRYSGVTVAGVNLGKIYEFLTNLDKKSLSWPTFRRKILPVPIL